MGGQKDGGGPAFRLHGKELEVQGTWKEGKRIAQGGFEFRKENKPYKVKDVCVSVLFYGKGKGKKGRGK